MKRIVECVPNFSEGRNRESIDQIAKAIRQKQVKLLSVEPDSNYNRTVITFAGEPEEVQAAAFEAIKTATSVIDMSRHEGEHPRLGATDVCPFVPITTTMKECVILARELGQKVGEELGIPVYLYDEAATTGKRRELSAIRQGEYEGLADRLSKKEWLPDYGPARFIAGTGAVIIGARPFLIAYNVNLNTDDVSIARKIAGRIRESGQFIYERRVPGSLKNVKALGILLKEHNIAQVSMNLTNYKVTGIHQAFEEVRHQTGNLGIQVTGSQIVGLVLREALLDAGRHLAENRGIPGASEMELMQVAISGLGLSQLDDFEPDKKVLEYALGYRGKHVGQ